MNIKAIITSIAILVTPATASATSVVCESVRGDINVDGHADIFDVQCHILTAANTLVGTPQHAANCVIPQVSETDQNCDHTVNVIDVFMTIQAALGLPWTTQVDGDGDGCADTCETIAFDCVEGWMNQHCDVRIGTCAHSNCPESARCVEENGGHLCME